MVMDDLISRQAAIEAMKNMYYAAEKWEEEASDDVIKARADSCMATLIEMKLRIEQLPPAQPEQKIGRWEKRYISDYRFRLYCSDCGEWQTHGETSYCPNCGARMEGGGMNDDR